jgi:hypothetical protein
VGNIDEYVKEVNQSCFQRILSNETKFIVEKKAINKLERNQWIFKAMDDFRFSTEIKSYAKL